MKKLITLTLALLLFSCAKEEKPEYTILSGKYLGTEENKFTIRGNSFEKEINVNSDGTFTDTLYLDYEGLYEIGRDIALYLEKDKNVSFEVNSEKPEEIVFSGDLSTENNYIAQKSKLSTEIMGNMQTFLSLEENDFLAKIDELSKKRNELVENTTFTANGFKEKELKNLKFNTTYILGLYPDYHPYFTNKEDFNISENFPKKDETIDFDNADDFNFSASYRILVQINFDSSVQREMDKEEKTDFYETSLMKLKAIKSQNIKNEIASSLSYHVNLSNEKMEDFYKELLASSTDEKFKNNLTEKYNKIKTLVKGNPSPKFNYENHKGGTTSLDDLKGKFVYIDVWATWCGPCKREIPFLKEVEKKYHGKNIEFVSISIDDKKDYETWKNFVTEQQLGGIQLYADNAWQSQFAKDYVIDGIPRFILIDTEGNIVSGDAPRPSDEKLIDLFNELGI
jgi:thiol-disulfide isomerase/thioredoxin